jgi:hypothetical protein
MSTVIRQGIYEKLAATGGVTSLLATTTSIFHGQAPPNAAYPFIIFEQAVQRSAPAYSARLPLRPRPGWSRQ